MHWRTTAVTAFLHESLLRLPWRMAEEWHAIVIADGRSARILRAWPASSVCSVGTRFEIRSGLNPVSY